MKCLKNYETGNIIRVDDKQAEQLAGRIWKYVSKSEWKLATRPVKVQEVVEKKSNPKQMDVVETEETFVKTRKKSK